MMEDRLQRQRFEKKYRVTEEVAARARDFVSSYLHPDEYGIGRRNFSYPVHSLYLDSDELATYWATINGDKNRFKLRLRFYDSHPDTPVFFEIKRRVDKVIFKQRGGVLKAAAPALLAGQLPAAADLICREPKQLVAIQRFCDLMGQLQARPKVHVAYLREAWSDPRADGVRVTFDRVVLGQPRTTAGFETEMTQPVRPFGSEVILEFKFTDRFPDWLREMVRELDLVRCSAAKYCECVGSIGENRFGAALSTLALDGSNSGDGPEKQVPVNFEAAVLGGTQHLDRLVDFAGQVAFRQAAGS